MDQDLEDGNFHYDTERSVWKICIELQDPTVQAFFALSDLKQKHLSHAGYLKQAIREKLESDIPSFHATQATIEPWKKEDLSDAAIQLREKE